MIAMLDGRQAEAAPEAFAAGLGRACRETGFFGLAAHGIAPALTERVFAQAAAFFALPQDAKEPLAIARTGSNRGWVPPGGESLDEASGAADQKEAFNIGLDLAADDPRVRAGEPFRGVNVWPDLPGFRDTMLAYYDAAWALGRRLMAAVAHDLGLPPEHFEPHFTAPLATLRLLSYPAAPASGPQEAVALGAGAHSDYGALTLLLTDGTPGLELRPRGRDWMHVPHRPGAFTVNIGDCLMRWTNDLYVSTPHRVRLPPRPRLSVAFFLDPDPDAVIAALPGTGTPRYAPVSAAAYLRARLDATHGAGVGGVAGSTPGGSGTA